METSSVSDMIFVHLSSAVCKFKAHKRCAVRSTNNCKWTTLASIGNDIIEDEDGVRAEAYSRVAFGFVFMQIILPDVHTFGLMSLEQKGFIWYALLIYFSLQVSMPHQWLEGNLPVSAKCVVCDKNCGSVRRLQDWRCLWCKAIVSVDWV